MSGKLLFQALYKKGPIPEEDQPIEFHVVFNDKGGFEVQIIRKSDQENITDRFIIVRAGRRESE